MNYLQEELYALIRQEESIFDFVQESTLDGMWYWDLENPEFEWMNNRFWTTLGYNPELMPHRTSAWQDIIFQEDFEAIQKSLPTYLERPELLFDQIVRYKHAQGHTVYIRCKGKVIVNADGVPVRMLGAHIDISNEIRSREELANQLARYDHIINAADLGTWEWNIQTGESNFNERYAQIAGYQLVELQPISIKTWYDLVHPEDLVRANKAVRDYLDGRIDGYECEVRIQHKNGNWVWVQVVGKVVKWNPDGTPLLMSGIHRDITSKRSTEMLAEKYRELLERSHKAARMGYWELNLENQEVFWSAVTREIYGLEGDRQPTYDEATSFYPESDRAQVFQQLQHTIETGRGFDYTHKIYTRQGELKWVRSIGQGEFENNRCIRIYGLLQDVDVSTRANIDLARQEELFRKVFQFAASGMATASIEGRFLKVNHSLCDFLGYSESELLSLEIEGLFLPEDLESNRLLFKELIDGLRDYLWIEIRFVHKKGHLIWGLLSASIIRDEKNEPLHFVGQINDISQQVQTQLKLNDSLQKLQSLLDVTTQQNERLLNFAHIVSHNLRSHAGNIKMMLDLYRETNSELMANEFMMHLEEASSHLNETVQHLSDVVLMNSLTGENLESLKLQPFFDKVSSMVSNSPDTQNVKVLFEPTDCTVLALPAYLESVISNLVTNGVKYRRQSKGAYVHVRAKENGEFIRVDVEDNGLGIDMNRHGGKIFGMYKTFHGNEDARGIGLFITKNQIESMGGHISVLSELNKGSIFSVFFRNGSTDRTLHH